MQIVHTISESGAATDDLFNGAHVFSSLNRKMIEPVDNKGNAKLFHFKVEAQSASECTTTLKTASTGYVTKQAVKAWYRVWRQQFRDAGISLKDLGPYGRVFKPGLQASDDTLGTSLEDGQGEWNYSDIVTVPPGTDLTSTDAVERRDLSDQYSLHLCGGSISESAGDETRKWTSVGMINSWIDSRKSRQGTGTADVPDHETFGADNPLILARADDLAGETLLDEVRDLQQDKAPYVETQMDELYIQSILKSNGTDVAVGMVSAPCGLLNVTTTAACDLIITLTGITDM